MRVCIFIFLAFLRESSSWNWNPIRLFRPLVFRPLDFLSKLKNKIVLEKEQEKEILPIIIQEKEKEKEKEWYIIGRNRDFNEKRLYEIMVKNQTYVLWKTGEKNFVAFENKCIHKGARLSDGYIDQKCMVCSYHNTYYNSLGIIIEDKAKQKRRLNTFEIIERNEYVYFCNTPDPEQGPKEENERKTKPNIYIESLEKPPISFLEIDYHCAPTVLMDFLLDMFTESDPEDTTILQYPTWVSKKNLSFHAQSIYQIKTKIDSISRRFLGENYFLLESEFVYPYTTIMKISCGEYELKYIASILPISDKKSRLFIKIFRNFWKNNGGDFLVNMIFWRLFTKEKQNLENISSENIRTENKNIFYRENERMREFYHYLFKETMA